MRGFLIRVLIVAAGLWAASKLVPGGVTVAGFWPAFFGAIVISITGWLACWFIGSQGRVETITYERL